MLPSRSAHIHTRLHTRKRYITTVQETRYSSSRFRGLLDEEPARTPTALRYFYAVRRGPPSWLFVFPSPSVPTFSRGSRTGTGDDEMPFVITYCADARGSRRVVVPLVFALPVSLAHALSALPKSLFLFSFSIASRPFFLLLQRGVAGRLVEHSRVPLPRAERCPVFIPNVDGSNGRDATRHRVCFFFRKSIVRAGEFSASRVLWGDQKI